tara:strand:+ start:54 stop:704 length:651 start_codon:yes stop_codon:yes gene_type:complete
MSSEIKSTTVQTNSLKDKTGTRTLASDSGSAWSWGSSVPKGSVIEQFISPCDGSSITVQSGTYTVQTVSTVQDLDQPSYSDVLGSVIDYTPPTGTQTVLYNYNFLYSLENTHNIAHFRLYLDNDSGTATEVTNFRTSLGADGWLEGRYSINWAFHIGGSDNDATGRRDTWTSARTIKLQAREYHSGNQSKLNQTYYWDGGAGSQFSQPVIGITALA